MRYFHGSNINNIESLKSTVGEFDNMGGIFLTPSLNFAKKWGKYTYEVYLLTTNIFDYEKEEHRKKYSDNINIKELNLSKEDIYDIIFNGNIFKYFSKVEASFKKYQDEFNKRKMKGKIRSKDEFGEPLDYWKSSEGYATEMLYEYPTKNINLLLSLKRYQLFKDYHSIEKNDQYIKNLGFDGAYIWEIGNKNIQLYYPDKVKIIGRITERIVRFENFKFVK